ncbi:DUF2441 domain-containing protein [Morganella morganii]
MKFYTADRSKVIKKGDVFDLYTKPQNLQNALSMIDPTFCDKDELEAYLSEFFPSGISRHGMQYLLDNNNHIRSNYKEPLITLSPAIEIIYETIRRNEFSEKPSRMTCAFACQSIPDAQNYFNDASLPIFEISTKNKYFIADSSLLKIGHNHLSTLVMARKYWSGSTSEAPQLEVLIECPAMIGERVA